MTWENVRSGLRVASRWGCGAALGVATLLVLYIAAGLIGGAAPVNRGWRPPAEGVRVFVESNGVHTGIVVPKVAAGVDWRDLARPEHLADPRYARHPYLSFGWGERAFYLETATWADVKLATVLAAAAGSGDTLVHLDHLPTPRIGPDVRSVVLRPDEYRRLAAFVRATFADRPRVHRGYGPYDAFYTARGSYSARRTCNAWTGEALAHAGVRTGWWTPFPCHGHVVAVTPRPPAKLLWAAELPRAAWVVASWWRHRTALAGVPPGDGSAVMLLPGLFNSDRSNFVLRWFLRRLGYRVGGWGLGRNRGARTIGPDAERLVARIEALAAEVGPVTLVGVSLGGMMARLVAHRRPDLVRAVVTVSSPYAGDPRATNIWRAFELFTGERIDDPAVRARGALIASALPVPATAIWSATDGLVAGAICRCDDARSVEVRSGHLGVQIKPEVLIAVAGAISRT